MQINDREPWRAKTLRSLQMSYGRAPHYRDIGPIVTELIEQPTQDLSQFNLNAIRRIADGLSLQTPFVLGSELAVAGQATEMLINLVKVTGGDAYLAGGGAAGYQEDASFREAGVELVYQDFQHPVYPQVNTDEFKPGMSIVDALMNLGFDGVRELLQAGARTA
jgi:WbqC-like protein